MAVFTWRRSFGSRQTPKVIRRAVSEAAEVLGIGANEVTPNLSPCGFPSRMATTAFSHDSVGDVGFVEEDDGIDKKEEGPCDHHRATAEVDKAVSSLGFGEAWPSL